MIFKIKHVFTPKEVASSSTPRKTHVAHHLKRSMWQITSTTTSNLACFGAVALGASILERHFTDYMERTGPDIICSMDEKSCKELIEGSELIWKMRGGKKKPAEEEKVTIDFAFATVCTISNIKKGEQFTKENLWVKRPGTGEVSAEKFNELIGKKASRDLINDEQLTWNDIENG